MRAFSPVGDGLFYVEEGGFEFLRHGLVALNFSSFFISLV
jgi:hypothetical protein